jgi:hypothetical protein
VDFWDLVTLMSNWPGEIAAGIAPTGTPAQPQIGITPTLTYNPLTGDLRFQRNGVTGTIATLMLWSFSADFDTQKLYDAAKVDAYVYRPDQIDLANLDGIVMSGGLLDLGPVLPVGLSLTQISNLTFSYQLIGQDPVRLGSVNTPEPSTTLLVGLGAAAGILARRRRRGSRRGSTARIPPHVSPIRSPQNQLTQISALYPTMRAYPSAYPIVTHLSQVPTKI